MTSDPTEEPSGPVIRDKRRIDPETGEIRVPRETPPPAVPDAAPDDATGPADDEVTASPSEAELALAERTVDLQRLQAEYVNYKRRVDRDRQVARDGAVAGVLTSLLPVLDDIGRARDHGELTGGFKAVADSLERITSGLGLVTFGEPGDAFDPRLHEALAHTFSDDVSGPVAHEVFQVGYQFGERVIRPARVAVAEPGGTLAPAEQVAEAQPVDDVGAAADEGTGHPS